MKVKIVYKPNAADRQEWVIDHGNPSWDVAYAVETATDWGWTEFRERLDGVSPTAWRALLWALLKRDVPRLRLESVEINDWAEIQRHFQCPACEEWVSFTEDVHECASPEPEDDDASEEPPAKKGKKGKGAGDDPEA